MNAKKFNRIIKKPCLWSNLSFEIINTLSHFDYMTSSLIKTILNFNGKIILEAKEECQNCECMLKLIAIKFALNYGLGELLPDIKKILEDPNISDSLRASAEKFVEQFI